MAPDSHDRDLRGPAPAGRQLALGRGAHLRAHRQAAAGPGDRGGAAVPQRARSWPSRASCPASCSPTPWCCASSPTRASACTSGPRCPARPSGCSRWPWTSRTTTAFAETGEADGYQRLLHDAMIGDATLFIRTDEVEQAWRIVDPYLEAWSEPGGGLHFYPAGTWGPHVADLLLERSGDVVAGARARERPPARRRRRRRPSPTLVAEAFAGRAGPALHPGAVGRPDRPGRATSGWPSCRRGDRRLVAWSTSTWATNGCVPPDDPDANQRLVREALLDRVGGVGSFTPMPTDGDPEACAAAYQTTIAAVLDGPGIDLVHLGLGPDGHTASLFPGSPTLEAGPDQLVVATDRSQRPQPPPADDPHPAGHRPGPPGRLHRGRGRPSARRWPSCGPGPTCRPPGCTPTGACAGWSTPRPACGEPSGRLSVTALADDCSTPLDELTAAAGKVRDRAHGNRVTYSPKVFIPLTMLCRDRCGYCTFAKAPARLASPYLVASTRCWPSPGPGRDAGCHEALFTLGERPEDRYPTAAPLAGRARLRARPSTTWPPPAGRCSRRPGCSPTPTPAPSYDDELAALRPVTASQGMMLETLAEAWPPTAGRPDKTPARRLATLEAAGRLAIPFTTGHPGRHRRDPGRPAGDPDGHRRRPPPPRPRPGGHRPELPAQAGHGHGRRTRRARPTSCRGRSPSPACCCRPRSTCRRRPTSPTTWPRCSTPASTTGAGSRR